MIVDNVYVGPEKAIYVNAVTDWTSTTVTQTGVPGTTSITWRRVGDTMHIKGKVSITGAATTAISVPLPTGYSVDATKYPTGATNIFYGSAAFYDSSVGNAYAGISYISSDTIGFYGPDVARWSDTLPVVPANGDYISFEIFVPISGWSSNIQVADRALEEFAYNVGTTTTAGAADDTNFGYGSAGTPVLAIDSTTGGYSVTSFRCRFQSPILPTDSLILEILDPGTFIWRDVANTPISERILAAGRRFGIGLGSVSGSTTDVYVKFGNSGQYTTSTTYDANGAAWAADGTRWRVRKTSGGAQVGSTAISARNIIGDTSGTAVPAGYLGQVIGDANAGTGGIGYNSRTTTAVPTTGATAAQLPALKKGTYIIGVFCAQRKANNTNADFVYGNLTVGGTAVSTANIWRSTASNCANTYLTVSGVMPILITTDDTIVRFEAAMNTENATAGANEIWAIRIA